MWRILSGTCSGIPPRERTSWCCLGGRCRWKALAAWWRGRNIAGDVSFALCEPVTGSREDGFTGYAVRFRDAAGVGVLASDMPMWLDPDTGRVVGAGDTNGQPTFDGQGRPVAEGRPVLLVYLQPERGAAAQLVEQDPVQQPAAVGSSCWRRVGCWRVWRRCWGCCRGWGRRWMRGGAGVAPSVLPEGWVASPGGPSKVVVNYLTQFDPGRNGSYVTPVDVLGAATHVAVGWVGLAGHGGSVVVNGVPSGSETYSGMWADLEWLQVRGTRVLAKVGGPDDGVTFRLLERDFDRSYAVLAGEIRARRLDGVDLDVAETTPVAVVERLIRALRSSFGPGFVISLSSTAAELDPASGVGLNITELFARSGDAISWLNVKFMLDDVRWWWGGAATRVPGGSMLTDWYWERLLGSGIPMEKLMVEVGTNAEVQPPGGPVGFDVVNLKNHLYALKDLFPGVAGVTGTEYVKAGVDIHGTRLGGGVAPWMWARMVHSVLNPPGPPAQPLAPKVLDAASAAGLTEDAVRLLRSTTGKVVAYFPWGQNTGSGGVVSTKKGNMVLSAGHVVYDVKHGAGLADNVIFIPGYDRGRAPWGEWVAYQVVVPDEYRNLVREGELRDDEFVNDVAVLLMRPQRGRHLEQVVGGGQGISFNHTGWPGQLVHSLGYPAGKAVVRGSVLYRSTGEQLMIGVGRTVLSSDLETGFFRAEPAIPVVWWTGASGGPIIGDIDPVTGRGKIFSVISFTHRLIAGGSLGALFGETVRKLYDSLQDVTEPPLLLRVTNRAEPGDGSVGVNASVSTPDGEVRGLGSVGSGQSVEMAVPLEGWDTFTVSAGASGHGESLTLLTPDPPVVSVEFGGNVLVGFELRLVDPASARIPDHVPNGLVDLFGSYVWNVRTGLLIAAGMVVTGAWLGMRPRGSKPVAGAPYWMAQPGRTDKVALVVSVDGDGMPLLDTGPGGALQAGDGRALAVYLTERRRPPAWSGRVVQIMTGSELSPEAWADFLEVARQAASMLVESGELAVNGTVSATGQHVSVSFDMPLRRRFELADDPLAFLDQANPATAELLRRDRHDRQELTAQGLGFYGPDAQAARQRAAQALGRDQAVAGDDLLVSQLALLDVFNRTHADDSAVAPFGMGAGDLAGMGGAVRAPGPGFDLFEPRAGVDLGGAVRAPGPARDPGFDLFEPRPGVDLGGAVRAPGPARDPGFDLFEPRPGVDLGGAVRAPGPAPGPGFDLFELRAGVDPAVDVTVDLFGLAVARDVPAVMAIAAARAAVQDLDWRRLPRPAAEIVLQAGRGLVAFAPPEPMVTAGGFVEVWPGAFGDDVRLFRRGRKWHVGVEADLAVIDGLDVRDDVVVVHGHGEGGGVLRAAGLDRALAVARRGGAVEAVLLTREQTDPQAFANLHKFDTWAVLVPSDGSVFFGLAWAGRRWSVDAVAAGAGAGDAEVPGGR